MKEKIGGGGKNQPYDEQNGQYENEKATTKALTTKEKLEQAKRIYGDDYEKEKNNTILTNKKSINSKLKDQQALTDEEIEEVIISISETYISSSRGKEDKNLKRILESNGFSKTPKKVKKEELVQVLSKGKVLYRGLNGDDAVKYKEQFYQGDLFVGTGFGGNGVYMSIDVNESNNYTKGSNVVACAIMPSDFKIAGKEIRKEYQTYYDKMFQKYKYQKTNSKQENEKNSLIMKTLSFGAYCALKGYDGYLPTIKPEINMVILNRGKLVIGEHYEQERIMELD